MHHPQREAQAGHYLVPRGQGVRERYLVSSTEPPVGVSCGIVFN